MAIGLAAGMVLALAGSRLLAVLLIGVSAHDPPIFASVAPALAAVALGACAVPAWRIAGSAPANARRAD